MVSHDDDAMPAPGRPVVLEPTAPGLWLTVVGGVVALLAPLFGFLIGSAMGAGDGSTVSPVYLGLFGGVVIGGCGVLVALLGARRLYLTWKAEQGA